jgi:glycosyltransferase involved in cell wall biosynthesis
MRILVYPHMLSVGGSQLNAIELAAAVRDLGHQVTVFAAQSGPLAETIARLRLPLVIAPAHTRRPSLTIASALRELCRREHIEIVHGYEWPPALEGFYGPFLRDGVAVGCTIMSMAVAPFLPRSLPLIVGTEQIAAAARNSGCRVVRVIEPPVDTTENHPGIDGSPFRAQYGLDDRLSIVLVSRLALALKLEGLERAIDAAASLAPETGARLVIVGDGPARERLQRRAADVNARTGDRTVTLTGELADPRPAYAAADVVLGMGGSALRAMAFAKPLVVLGELGFAQLLTPESADTFLWQGFYGLGDGDSSPGRLVDMLRPLLTDSARRQSLGAFSRHWVETRFSLTRAAQQQVEHYKEWLNERPHRARAALEGGFTAAQLVVHKARRRIERLSGRQAPEDFNTVAVIAKTATARTDPQP